MATRDELSPGRRLRYRLDAGLVHFLNALLRPFSIDRAGAIGAWFGRKVLAPLSRDNPNTVENIRTAFPQLDDAGVRDTLTASYENVGRMFGEIALIERFVDPSVWQGRFTVTGLEHLRAAQATGKGIIIATGHFANWEMIGVALRHLGVPYSAVSRPSTNPYVEDWIAKKRKIVGVRRGFAKGTEGTRGLFTALRGGEAVVMLIDQRFPQGIPAPMFGRDVLTTPGPATFAQKLDVPVLPMTVRRTEGSHFEVIFSPVLLAPRSGNDARDILAMTADLNRFIEGEVRARPAHWLWSHRRFKPADALSNRATRVLGAAEAGP